MTVYRRFAIVIGCLLVGAGLLLWRIYPAIDAALSARLRLKADQPGVSVLVAATHLGGATFMIPVAFAFILYLAMTKRWRAGAWAFLVIASGRILIEGTKDLIGRARPPADGHLVSVATASFPSSHTAGSALTVLTLLAAYGARWPAWLAGGAWITIIGFSRIMLGVHWPSDVLAGWGLGVTWMAIFYRTDATFFDSRSLRYRD